METALGFIPWFGKRNSPWWGGRGSCRSSGLRLWKLLEHCLHTLGPGGRKQELDVYAASKAHPQGPTSAI